MTGLPETLTGELRAIRLLWVDQGKAVSRIVDVARPSGGELTYRQLLTSLAVQQLIAADAIAGVLAGQVGLASFGRRRRLDDPVGAGDRVEILPALLADPMAARRKRVDARRQQSRRDRWHTNRRGEV